MGLLLDATAAGREYNGGVQCCHGDHTVQSKVLAVHTVLGSGLVHWVVQATYGVGCGISLAECWVKVMEGSPPGELQKGWVCLAWVGDGR